MKRTIKIFLVVVLIFCWVIPVESQRQKNVKKPKQCRVKIGLYDLYSAYKDAKRKQEKREIDFLLRKIEAKLNAQRGMRESCSELRKILPTVSLVDVIEYKLEFFKPNDDEYALRLKIAERLFMVLKGHQRKINSIRSPLSTSQYNYSDVALSTFKTTTDPKLRKYLVLSEFIKRTEYLQKHNIPYTYKGRDFNVIAQALSDRKKNKTKSK